MNILSIPCFDCDKIIELTTDKPYVDFSALTCYCHDKNLKSFFIGGKITSEHGKTFLKV